MKPKNKGLNFETYRIPCDNLSLDELSSKGSGILIEYLTSVCHSYMMIPRDEVLDYSDFDSFVHAIEDIIYEEYESDGYIQRLAYLKSLYMENPQEVVKSILILFQSQELANKLSAKLKEVVKECFMEYPKKVDTCSQHSILTESLNILRNTWDI